MGIWYKYAGYEDKLSDDAKENKVRPIAISQGCVGTQQIADRIVSNNYYASPDAVKAVEAVFTTIEQLLKEGYSVTVDGYGSFQPTLRFVKKKVDNTDPEKKEKSVDLRAESIEVKSVVFHATSAMKGRLGIGNIERMPKNAPKKKGR